MENKQEIDILNNSEIPPFVYNITTTGIVFLLISFFTCLALNLAYDYNNDLRTNEISRGQTALSWTTIVFGVLGFLLSCTVFYGYTLKNKNDPKSVITGPLNIIQFPHAGTDIVMNGVRNPFESSYETTKGINKSNLDPKYL